MKLTNYTRVLLPLLALCPSAFAAGPIAQDTEVLKERSRARVEELYETRIELMLVDLDQVEPFGDGGLELAKAKGSEAVATFLEEHPVKIKDLGEIAWTANPILFTPFAEFLESESWVQARDAALSSAQVSVLEARSRARDERLRNALAGLTGAILARGLCLAPEELQRLEEVCKKAAEAKIVKGLVSPMTGMEFAVAFDSPKDHFAEMVQEAGLLDALTPPRRALVTEMMESGRTDEHDLLLEAECLLHSRPDKSEARRLLYGCVRALIHRDGKKPKKRSRLFVPGRSPSKQKFWAKSAQRILDLAEEPTDLPSKSVEGLVEFRSQYVLAALDQRAVMSLAQRESLLPLIRQFVEAEVGRGRGGSADRLNLPSALRISREDRLVPGLGRGEQQSAKTRALVKTLFEACTPQQRDVLGQ